MGMKVAVTKIESKIKSKKSCISGLFKEPASILLSKEMLVATKQKDQVTVFKKRNYDISWILDRHEILDINNKLATFWQTTLL